MNKLIEYFFLSSKKNSFNIQSNKILKISDEIRDRFNFIINGPYTFFKISIFFFAMKSKASNKILLI